MTKDQEHLLFLVGGSIEMKKGKSNTEMAATTTSSTTTKSMTTNQNNKNHNNSNPNQATSLLVKNQQTQERISVQTVLQQQQGLDEPRSQSSWITSSFSSSSFASLFASGTATSMSTPSFGTPQQSPHGSPWIRKPLSVVHHQQRQQEDTLLSYTRRQPVESDDSNHNPHHHQDHNQQQLQKQKPQQLMHRHLSVWDLIGIGVGGTVGSGIFVLTGQIANQYSGPGTAISMFIAGISATCSGVCYAELSSRIPVPGSTYVYAYICWGELAAVVAASCLTLEYAISGAAVARTWGDKVIEWIASASASASTSDGTSSNTLSNDDSTTSVIESWLLPFDGAFNIPAFAISAISTLLLLSGVSESKAVLNVITAVKMMVVATMVIGGFLLYDSNNMPPVVPLAPFGVAGILRGSTTSFFGFLGYDEVCCVAGEAKNPVRDMPRAVLGTLVTVTVCYVLASIALTGMMSYNEISPTSGFPAAFAARDAHVLGHITALGEVVTLPVVVVISLLAQPRLLYSMAQDGLLPSIFAKMDPSNGNLIGGTAISGICMTLIAAFVPFTYLDDLISAGILTAFSMTNSCLILLRCKKVSLGTLSSTGRRSAWYLEMLLILYNSLCFITAILWTHDMTSIPLWNARFQMFVALVCTGLSVWCLIHMIRSCPTTPHFGGSILKQGETDRHVPSFFSSSYQPTPNEEDVEEEDDNKGRTGHRIGVEPNSIPASDHEYFRTPAVPLLPCLGTAVNWYLIAQLDITGLLLLCLYILLTIVLYGAVCAPNSVGHLHNWNHHNHNTNTDTINNNNNNYTSTSKNSNHKKPPNNNHNYYCDTDDGELSNNKKKKDDTNHSLQNCFTDSYEHEHDGGVHEHDRDSEYRHLSPNNKRNKNVTFQQMTRTLSL